jgi:hypothetical protein
MSKRFDSAEETSLGVETVKRHSAPPLSAPKTMLLNPMQRLALVLVVVILLLNAVAGGVVWMLHANATSQRATADLTIQLGKIRAWASSPSPLDTTDLVTLQTAMSAAQADLITLKSAIPFDGMFAGADKRQIAKKLIIGSEELAAAKNVVAAAVLILPGLRSLVTSTLGAPPAPGIAPLTLDTIHLAQKNLRDAQLAWQIALAEQSALEGSGSAETAPTSNAPLDALFTYTTSGFPALSQMLALSSALIDDLPSLLALNHPDSHVLLLYMDTDQQRPVGGSFDAYGLVSFKAGSVAGNIVVRDTNALDCMPQCGKTPLPNQYAWFAPAHTPYGLQNSGLGFDYQRVAIQAVSLFSQESGVLDVNGAITITPKVAQQVLSVTGPVHLGGGFGTISAQNLRGKARFWHSQVATSTAQGAPSTKLSFDSALLSAIIRRLALATPTQLGQIGNTLFHDLARGDLLVYANSARINNGLQAFNLGGGLFHSNSDSIYVTNTELDHEYNSADVATRIADVISLSRDGIARHRLSVTNTYRPTGATSASSFTDVVAIVLPPKATLLSSTTKSCMPVRITLSGSVIYACQVTLKPNHAVTVTLSWAVRGLFSIKPHGTPGAYTLFIQRQPGAAPAVQVSVTAPVGTYLTTTLPGIYVSGTNGQWSTAALTSNTSLSMTISS